MLAVALGLQSVGLIHPLDCLCSLVAGFDRAITQDNRGAGRVVQGFTQAGRVKVSMDTLNGTLLLVPIGRIKEAARLQVVGFDEGVVGRSWILKSLGVSAFSTGQPRLIRDHST